MHKPGLSSLRKVLRPFVSRGPSSCDDLTPEVLIHFVNNASSDHHKGAQDIFRKLALSRGSRMYTGIIPTTYDQRHRNITGSDGLDQGTESSVLVNLEEPKASSFQ